MRIVQLSISRFVLSVLLISALLPLTTSPVHAAGVVSLNALDTAYTQDFNTLASSGTASTTPTGWDFAESGTNANTTYTAGTGSGNAGDTYSFGASGATERAFGGLQSGSLNPTIGAAFINNTGATLTSLAIAFTGEQWRLGATSRGADQLDFQLSTDATSLTSGTWTDTNELDFSSPVTAGTIGLLDGNAAANRTAVSFTLSGLNVPPGASFWIRWTDFNVSSSDDGLSIDDFSLTPSGIVVTTPLLSVSDVSLSEGNASTTAFDFTVSLSAPAGAGGVTFDIATADGTALVTDDYSANSLTGQTIPEGASSYAFSVQVSGDTTPEANETFFVNVTNVTGATLVDDQGQGTILNDDSFCALPFTPVYQIQGSGLSAAVTGNVTTQGVVVGDFEGSASASGFYLQDLAGDSNTATSDGIFVYTGSANTVSLGDVVRVTGYARERFNQTALNGSNSNTAAVPAANILACGTGSVPPVDIEMPFPDPSYLERFEGMLVRFPQSLVISEYFNYDRFGEIVLALPLDGESRPFTGTAIDEPGAAANARTAANSLRRITLDDANSSQNPAVLRHPNGQPFSLDNKFRGGDTVANAVGVLGFDFSLYRIVPTGPADYTPANPRPASPESVGGALRVGAMNTLNFFVTPDDSANDNICGPLRTLECRGWDADQPTEFTRQRDKLLQALSGLDADVLGLNELENTAGVEPLESIVSGLPGYAYINTGTIGTDAIKVGLIYRPEVVTPVGDFKLLTTAVDPRFLDTKNRPTLAQTFEVNATGARFTVVVNHLKSKGSDCNDVGDPDLLDGQGNCNLTRKGAAQALVDWLATDPTGSGDPDFLILGDLNSYAMEDPIDAVKAGPDDTPGTADDFTNLIAQFQGPYAYSYTFDGQAGYLDYALASPSLLSQVVGAVDWHINSDEPDVLDYDTSFKPPSQDALYETNPYRTSDHDPVVVGLDLNTPPVANNDSYSTNEDTPLTVAAPGVLANDTDGNGDTLTAVLVTGPSWGTLTLNSDGSFTYTPATNFNGTDSFTYKANDSKADSNNATVTITVNSINDAPVAVDDAMTVAKNASGTVVALANDYDMDGDTLTVVSYTQGTNGSVKYSLKNNNFRYTPIKGFSGTDTFTYTISDGQGGTATATVTVTVLK